MDRVITVYSNVIEGFNATQINSEIAAVLVDFELPEGYSYSFTGEQQEQPGGQSLFGIHRVRFGPTRQLDEFQRRYLLELV